MFIPPDSYCITKQYYSSSLPLYRGLSPLSAPLSIGFSRSLHYNCVLPLELFLVRSPLLKKSKFVSSPVLIDMLKFRTYSCIAASLQSHGMRHVYRILYVGHRLGNLSILYMSCCWFVCSDWLLAEQLINENQLNFHGPRKFWNAGQIFDHWVNCAISNLVISHLVW